MIKIPESIEKHQEDYRQGAWEDYSFIELGMWIHVLTIRASHRSNLKKKKKDLYDAQNYLNIIQSKLDALK